MCLMLHRISCAIYFAFYFIRYTPYVLCFTLYFIHYVIRFTFWVIIPNAKYVTRYTLYVLRNILDDVGYTLFNMR